MCRIKLENINLRVVFMDNFSIMINFLAGTALVNAPLPAKISKLKLMIVIQEGTWLTKDGSPTRRRSWLALETHAESCPCICREFSPSNISLVQ